MYELWFRAVYEQDLIDRKFTSAIRPGNRSLGLDKSVPVGETARIRILKRPSMDIPGLSSVFLPFDCLVRITSADVLKLRDLTVQHLADCSEDVRQPRLAKYHLGLIYNREFSDDEDITLISWEYLTEE